VSYSQATLIKRTRIELNDNPWYDTCVEAMDTTETGLDVTDGTKYSTGVVVEFQDDGELCLVLSVSSNTLTVIRNYNFSVTATAGTGTSHATSMTIAADPRYRYTEITEAISTAMSELYPYVYRTVQISLTPVSGKQWYDLANTSVLDINSIVQESGTTGTTSSGIHEYGRDAVYSVRLGQNLPVAKITTGPGLYIRTLRDVTNTIYVNAIAAIDDTASGGNYTYITGNDEANCLIFMAASKLVGSLEIVRTTQEDVSMGDATVQPGSRRNLAQYLEAKGLAERRRWEIKVRQKTPVLPVSRGRLA
jgi:hypothetical protein